MRATKAQLAARDDTIGWLDRRLTLRESENERLCVELAELGKRYDALIAKVDGRMAQLEAENERLRVELAQQNELRRMEAEALAGVNKEVERRLRARIAALETALRGATHEVLFDPTGPRHVMAIDMAEFRRIAKLLEEQPV